jgi:nucleoside-diphosphate-sugar epimerase
MTIVGHGDIAGAIPPALANRPGWLWFASGVSNSAETSQAAFDREYALLCEQDRAERFVYFSSLSIFYADTPYTRHKRDMEDFVMRHCEPYAIVRIGTITWGRNPRLLIPHLRAQYAAGWPLDIQDTCRYVVDLDEFQHWLGLIPAPNAAGDSYEMNITGRRLTVRQIVERYVAPLGEFYRVA